MRKINKAGLDLIKYFEGFYPKAYNCPAGVLTIGYGHTNAMKYFKFKDGDVITEAKADKILQEDLAESSNDVETLTAGVVLNDDQFAALVSFVFNCGRGNFASSTLLKRLKAGNFADVPTQLKRWTRGGGVILKGLVRRRDAESALFMSDTAMAQSVMKK